jgi:hypothetical protein
VVVRRDGAELYRDSFSLSPAAAYRDDPYPAPILDEDARLRTVRRRGVTESERERRNETVLLETSDRGVFGSKSRSGRVRT